MKSNLFDEAMRRAFERFTRAKSRSLNDHHGWYFDRRRLGLIDLEACPFGIYAPICGDDADERQMQALLAEARLPRVGRINVHLNPLEGRAAQIADAALQHGFMVQTRQTHLLKVSDSIDLMRQSYNPTKRYEATRSVHADSLIVLASRDIHLDDFFSVYSLALARWGRSQALYSRELFEGLVESDAVKLWMNYVNGRLACAMLVLYCSRFALYWHGASSVDDDQKKAFPGVRLMDAVLQDLIAMRIPYLNLGASDSLPTVRRFKEGFGAKSVDYLSLAYQSRTWSFLVDMRQRFRREQRSADVRSTNGQ